MASKIYVYLLDEGTDGWRPVLAERISSDVYLIIDIEPSDDDDEVWEFKTGETVRVREKKFSGGNKGLVAYEKAPA